MNEQEDKKGDGVDIIIDMYQYLAPWLLWYEGIILQLHLSTVNVSFFKIRIKLSNFELITSKLYFNYPKLNIFTASYTIIYMHKVQAYIK